MMWMSPALAQPHVKLRKCMLQAINQRASKGKNKRPSQLEASAYLVAEIPPPGSPGFFPCQKTTPDVRAWVLDLIWETACLAWRYVCAKWCSERQFPTCLHPGPWPTHSPSPCLLAIWHWQIWQSKSASWCTFRSKNDTGVAEIRFGKKGCARVWPSKLIRGRLPIVATTSMNSARKHLSLAVRAAATVLGCRCCVTPYGPSPNQTHITSNWTKLLTWTGTCHCRTKCIGGTGLGAAWTGLQVKPSAEKRLMPVHACARWCVQVLTHVCTGREEDLHFR